MKKLTLSSFQPTSSSRDPAPTTMPLAGSGEIVLKTPDTGISSELLEISILCIPLLWDLSPFRYVFLFSAGF